MPPLEHSAQAAYSDIGGPSVSRLRDDLYTVVLSHSLEAGFHSRCDRGRILKERMYPGDFPRGAGISSGIDFETPSGIRDDHFGAGGFHDQPGGNGLAASGATGVARLHEVYDSAFSLH